MFWTPDNTAGYTNLLECKEGLGPKIVLLEKAAKANPSAYKDKLELAKKVYETKIDPEQRKILQYIEKKYECSGLCNPPFFYLTQSIEKGPPKQACLVPIIKDIGPIFKAVAAIMVTTAVVFFCMLTCTCAICGFNSDKYKEEMLEESKEGKRAEKYEAKANSID